MFTKSYTDRFSNPSARPLINIGIKSVLPIFMTKIYTNGITITNAAII